MKVFRWSHRILPWLSFQVKGTEFCTEEYQIYEKCPDPESCYFDMIHSESSISVTLECADKRCIKIPEKTAWCSPFFFSSGCILMHLRVELLQGTKVTKGNSVPAAFIVTRSLMVSHMKTHFLGSLWMLLFQALHNCMSFSGAALPMLQCYLLLNANCLGSCTRWEGFGMSLQEQTHQRPREVVKVIQKQMNDKSNPKNLLAVMLCLDGS